MKDLKEERSRLREMTHVELISATVALVNKEKECEINLVVHLTEIYLRKIYIGQGYSCLGQYCSEYLRMSENQGWKRAQVVRAILFHPELFTMLATGELSITQLSMIGPRLTEANKEIILKGITGKSKRETEYFLSTVGPDGSRRDTEPTREISFTCPQSLADKIERAKEIMIGKRKGPGIVTVLEEAIEMLLDKRDPVRKAERAEKRREQLENSETRMEESTALPSLAQEILVGVSPAQEVLLALSVPVKADRNRYIPAAIRHRVTIRDGGQCTFVGTDGRRCQERGAIQMDHRKMWCHGGDHTVDNLTVLCSTHNKYMSERILGQEFTATKIAARKIDQYSSAGTG